MNDNLNESKVDDRALLLEIQSIKKELQIINANRIFTVYRSIPKVIMSQFFNGLAFGLGSFLGASIVVSVIVYLLSQIEFIPIIGDFVKLIMKEIKL